MIAWIKDRYKLGLLLAALFLVGILISLYQVYNLPHNLLLPDGYHPAFTNVYLVLGLTFAIGAFTIWSALNSRNEIIVYRDRQNTTDANANNNGDESKTTISLDTLKDGIKSAMKEKEILQSVINIVCKQLDAGQGAVYKILTKDEKKTIELQSGYALSIGESKVISFDWGEGLVGQAAASAKTLYVDDVPDGYVKIVSGLGIASPRYLLIVPVKNQEQVLGVMEIATFTPLDENQRRFVEESAQLAASKITGQ
jgi:transcriptional regulator with GAF, ATPase, and Fis domain